MQKLSLSLIALVSVSLACAGPATPTPDARATQSALAAMVESTLTALAPTATMVPSPTNTRLPTATRLPSSTPYPSATRRPATPIPLQVYYLFVQDYVRLAEPYVLQNTYPPCRAVRPYAVDPSRPYYPPGFEPGGPIQKMYENVGWAYDPEQFRLAIVAVECR